MNWCEQVEKIFDYRLHQLTDRQKKEFEVHLKSCTVCQHELAIEMAVEDELSFELQPGFIENTIMVRLEVQKDKDMRSFWLYSYRTAVLGIAAAIACFILLPYLLRFPINSFPALSKHATAFVDFFGGVAAVDPVFLFIGFGYSLLIASSIYALGHMRR